MAPTSCTRSRASRLPSSSASLRTIAARQPSGSADLPPLVADACRAAPRLRPQLLLLFPDGSEGCTVTFRLCLWLPRRACRSPAAGAAVPGRDLPPVPVVAARAVRPQLVQLFQDVRDNWIKEDLAGWLAPNRIYDGVAQPVAHAQQRDEVYIVTTKMVRSLSLPLPPSPS